MDIKKVREKLMLSQEEFCKVVGVSIQAVSYWERNIKRPSLKHKRKIVELCKQNDISKELWEE